MPHARFVVEPVIDVVLDPANPTLPRRLVLLIINGRVLCVVCHWPPAESVNAVTATRQQNTPKSLTYQTGVMEDLHIAVKSLMFYLQFAEDVV